MNIPQQPMPPDFAVITLRIQAHDEQLKTLQAQLQQYELARENELKFLNLRAEVDRVARDQLEIKLQQAELKRQLDNSDKERLAADASQKESQLQLVNRFLYGIVGGVTTIIIAVVVFVLTHVAF